MSSRFLSGLGKSLTALVVVGILIAAAPVKRSEQTHCTLVFQTSTDIPEWINESADIPSECKGYNTVCWRNMGTDVDKFVYISSFSNTATATTGWPVAGKEKECHDFGPNVPLWLVNASGDTNIDFRLLLAK